MDVDIITDLIGRSSRKHESAKGEGRLNWLIRITSHGSYDVLLHEVEEGRNLVRSDSRFVLGWEEGDYEIPYLVPSWSQLQAPRETL